MIPYNYLCKLLHILLNNCFDSRKNKRVHNRLYIHQNSSSHNLFRYCSLRGFLRIGLVVMQ